MALKPVSPPQRVRLVGGVRDTLSQDLDPDLDLEGADIGKEDRDAEEAALERLESELEQDLRGNSGSHHGIRSVPDISGLNLEADEDAEEMGEEELSRIIGVELSESMGDDADELEGNRTQALNYYFGRPRGDEMVGRSKLQSMDVADMVESVLAQVITAFTDDLTVTFETFTSNPQELDIAQQESKTVNYVVQQENDGYLTFYTALKDALLLRNGVVKVYLDESLTVEVEEYPAATPEMLMLIQSQKGPGEEVFFTRTEEGGVEVRRVRKQRRIVAEAVPLEEIRVNSDHASPILQDARFVSHERTVRRSELIALGVSAEVIDDLPTSSDNAGTTADARDQTGGEGGTDGADNVNPSYDVSECWMMVDYDGDGLDERRRVLRASDGTILMNKPVDYMGIISGVVFVNGHRWNGISLYDKLKEVQDFKTHFLRQGADNATIANNRRMWYIKRQVDEDALFASKPGGGVPVKEPNSLGEIPAGDILPSLGKMLEYGDKMRTERAGASLDMQSQQVPMQNRTAHGAERVISAMEQITAMLASTFANTLVRGVYLAVHHLLRTEFPGGYLVPSKKPGQAAMQTRPGIWPRRDRITLTLGLSIGERLKIATALRTVIEQQTLLLEKGFGGTLVTEEGLYHSLVEYAHMLGVPNPQQYFTDPRSPQAQQAAQAKQQQAMEQQAKMEAQQNQVIQLQKYVIDMQELTKRLLGQQKTQVEGAKLAEDRRQHGEDLATEITELELKYNQDLEGGVGEDQSASP